MDADTIVRIGLVLLVLIAVVIALLGTRGTRSRRAGRRSEAVRRTDDATGGTSEAGFWAWSDAGRGSDGGRSREER